ncbi:MAG: hypothetical protein KDE56_01730 [Anaerolineales bacterium]|nr:hypothetical protein [Anaerolineales bacterium]
MGVAVGSGAAVGDGSSVGVNVGKEVGGVGVLVGGVRVAVAVGITAVFTSLVTATSPVAQAANNKTTQSIKRNGFISDFPLLV